MKNTLLTLATTLFLLASCGPEDGTDIVAVTDIIITPTPDPMTLVVGGEPGRILVEIAPANATYKTVEISVSPEGVVTVDNEGIVTPVGPGTATITATALLGDATRTCTVTVREPESIMHAYTGTFIVAPGTDDEVVIENATIEFVISPDRTSARMKMMSVSFAPGRMPDMDITVPGIPLTCTSDDAPFTFSGEGIVPTTVIGGQTVEVDMYTITGFEGEGTSESLSWSMMCGPYPLSFTGTYVYDYEH